MSFQIGYHLREIKTKGTYGESSKIHEELDEFDEAMEQNNKIMALVELSDIYGALEGLAVKMGSNMSELAKMSCATKRAFNNGIRESK